MSYVTEMHNTDPSKGDYFKSQLLRKKRPLKNQAIK